MKKIYCLALAILLTCSIALSRVAWAQATGTISGVVMDSAGAAIPGATVAITEVNTNVSRSLVTDSDGRFTANLMPLGNYRVEVSSPNFQKAVKTGILLEAEGSPTVNFTLVPASVTSSVQVEAAPVEVQTNNAALGQVIHAQQVADLPLNGRNFVELATLAPGTSVGQQPGDFFSGGGGSETSIRGTFSLSVNGSRENRTDWLFDGVDNNELTSGAIGVVPSIDALQEFNVLVSNYSVQYGTRAGPTVLLISKSGTNKFHGTLFDFLRNTNLNSSGYFATSNPEYIQNQFGGSIGGPIRKDKTFFFFDYQGTRRIEGIPSVTQVPTALERQGNFTESFPGAPEVGIYDGTQTTTSPITGLQGRPQFPNNTIPASELNPIAVKMLNYFPEPNVPGVLSGDYVDTPKQIYTDNDFDIRIDNVFSEKDRGFARFSRDQASVYLPSGLPDFGSQPGGYDSNQTLADHGRNLAISETHIFSPTKLNQFTAGYNRIFDHIVSYGDGNDWSTLLGIPNANLGTYFSSGLLNTQFNDGYYGLGDRGFSPIQDGTNIFQYSDDFEWVHGAHSFSMGIGIRFMQLNELGDTYPMGEFSFDNLFSTDIQPPGTNGCTTASGCLDSSSGNPIASFLLGLPAGGEHDDEFSGSVSGRRWKEYRPYFQDDWKVKQNMTLQLGLAYNYTTPIVEAINRQANFDFTTGQLLIAGVNSSKSAGVQPYGLDFEPRVGITYSPWSPKNVIRAGYAIQHDAGWNLGAEGLDLNPPFYGSFAFQTDDITPVTTLSQGFPAPTVPDVNNLTGNVYSQNLNYRPGIIQQMNINVQRELPAGMVLTVGYAGSRGSHQPTAGYNLNTAPPNPQIDPSNLRPYPNLNTIFAFLDRGLSRYDSLQAKLEKSYRQGIYFLVAYTYSKGFDNGLYDDLGSLVGIPYYPLNPAPNAYPNDPNGFTDKGLNVTDQTNNFSASLLYKLPFGQGTMLASSASGVTQQLIGNWQFNLISHMTSGVPLGLSTGVNNSGTALGNRPNQICSGKLSNPTVLEFFNTACFPDPADAGVLGDANRTPLYGPDFINFDSSLFKAFSLPHQSQLVFRAEVFNIFNHPQFANPGTTTDSAGFGQITSIVNNPRLIQLALKYVF